MIRTRIWPAAALVSTILLSLPATAADYYVDQAAAQADDTNPGSESLPWRTLQRAVEQELAPGDTVYVRPGVYSAASPGGGYTPGILIRNSGAPGNPITFKSTVPHGAVITGNGADGPLFGSMFRDYIVIDGFHVRDARKKGMIVYGDPGDRAVGVELRNNKISGISLGSNSPPADNTSGVRIEWASDTLLRSNEIWDVYNPSRTTNANGVSLYNTLRTTIEHNAIGDTIAGIKHKEASDDTVIRYNRIRCDNTGAALVIENQSSPISPPGSVSGRAEGFHFYQNVVRDCSNGVTGAGGSTTPIIGDVRIYNNVFYGLTDIGVRAIENGTGRFVYNNVFHRLGHPPAEASGDVVTPHYGSELYSDLKFSDYNLHTYQAKYVIGRYTSYQQQLFGLDQIRQTTAYADNSLELVDPQFVDPAAGDFRLAPPSPARNGGRVVTISNGGVTVGGRTNIGAYITGEEVIGPLPPENGDPVPVAPTIGSIAVTTAQVGQLYSYDVDATGEPAPTYRLQQAPAGMTINGATGLIDWTPTTAGDVAVEVVAENTAGADSQSFTITVQPASGGDAPGTPGTPTFRIAYGASSATVDVTWTEPATGPVPTYRYTAGYDSGPAWSAQGSVSETAVVLSNVPLGGTYWFCVRAVNALGEESADQACNSFQTDAGTTPTECGTPRAEWIWCDDFEQDRMASYFEASPSLQRRAGAGLGGSTGIAARYLPGVSEAGNLKVAFGRTPSAYLRPVDAGTRDYRDIYWRMYLMLPTGWQGGGADKLSRATILARADWSQAMSAHVWSGTDPGPEQNYLMLDPASGTSRWGFLRTRGYNDTDRLRWLGIASSQTPIFAPEYRGQWHCIEARARLNDRWLANGEFTLWIDGRLEAQRTGLNWVGNFDDYGINAVFFENYWNAGSTVEQERYIDNLVISTARIGCDA